MNLAQITTGLSYPPEVKDFIREKIKDKIPPDLMITIAQRAHGKDYANAVADAYAKRSSAIAGAYFESQRLFRRRLKELGVEPTQIRNKQQHMQAAIEALLEHIAQGKKPSASRAAKRPGLDASQAKKLAYNVPVKKEWIQEVLARRPNSPLVLRLTQDAGMKGVVINSHSSLARLAGALSNVNRSLAQRVADLEAAVMQLTGDALSQREGGNSRGHWHPQALQLRSEGKTVNQIARLLGRSNGAVKQVLSRHTDKQSRH